MKHLSFLLLIATLFAGHRLRSQTSLNVNTAKLDSLFTMLDQSRSSMCTITIMQDGKPLYSRRIGFRDSTKQGVLMPDANSRYRIASISKMFVSVMIQQLIEEGKLSYDTKLSAFYPQIVHADSISIRQMLGHHSGLPRYDRASELEKLMKVKSKDELIAKIAKEEGIRADVSKGHYSNLNYILLGFIVESLTGSTLDQQLRLRITDRLGLANTYGLQDYISAAKNEVHSFRMYKGLWTEDFEDHYAFADGSGYMVSTSAELAAFVSALFANKLISEASLREMCRIDGNFGLGIFPAPFGAHKGYGHTGRIEGFVSAVGYFPDDKLAIALIVNGQVYPMNDILIGVLSILYNEPYTIPSLKKISLTEGQLRPFEGQYTCTETPMSIRVKVKGNGLQMQLKQKGRLLKQVIRLAPISESRFMYDSQGIIADFDKKADGSSNKFLLRISGAKLHFERKK